MGKKENVELRRVNPSVHNVGSYFETYSNFLGSFACEKAKDFAETEKQQLVSTHLQVQ